MWNPSGSFDDTIPFKQCKVILPANKRKFCSARLRYVVKITPFEIFAFILSSRTWSEACKANRSCQTTPTAYVVPFLMLKKLYWRQWISIPSQWGGGGVVTFASFVEYVLRTLTPTEVASGAGFEIDGCQASKPSNNFFWLCLKNYFNFNLFNLS